MRVLITGGAGFTPPLRTVDAAVCYYVYVLRSRRSGTLYFGCTSDLSTRIVKHKRGDSLATKGRGPWELIYYEAYRYREAAFSREKSLKQFGGAYRQLKRRLHHELNGVMRQDPVAR